MPEKAERPSIGIPPLSRPQQERLINLTPEEQLEFWRLVLRSKDFDWVSMRVWSNILFYNA